MRRCGLSMLAVVFAFLGGMSGLMAQSDLSGSWDNGSGIDFIQPAKVGDSICVVACDEVESGPPRPRVMPARPLYRPEYQAKVKELEARQVEEDPVLRCYPPGVPRIGPPDKIVQTDREVIFLYDDVAGNFFRVLPTDGRPHRDDVEPSFMGDAVAWWEGESLVVETVNFNDQTWLTDDGSFHTTELKVIERLHVENDQLVWEATAHDPQVLAEPWQLPPRTATRSEREIMEAPLCLERDLEHMVDMSHHDNPR